MACAARRSGGASAPPARSECARSVAVDRRRLGAAALLERAAGAGIAARAWRGVPVFADPGQLSEFANAAGQLPVNPDVAALDAGGTQGVPVSRLPAAGVHRGRVVAAP